MLPQKETDITFSVWGRFLICLNETGMKAMNCDAEKFLKTRENSANARMEMHFCYSGHSFC